MLHATLVMTRTPARRPATAAAAAAAAAACVVLSSRMTGCVAASVSVPASVSTSASAGAVAASARSAHAVAAAASGSAVMTMAGPEHDVSAPIPVGLSSAAGFGVGWPAASEQKRLRLRLRQRQRQRQWTRTRSRTQRTFAAGRGGAGRLCMSSVASTGEAAESAGRPVASGLVVQFSPGRNGLGGVAAVRMREGDVDVDVDVAADVDAGVTVVEGVPGMFGRVPGVYGAKKDASNKNKQGNKGDDSVGRMVTFANGRTGTVVAERPPIAFVLCDFDELDGAAAAEIGADAVVKETTSLGKALVLDSMATIDAPDSVLGKVLDWRGRLLKVAEDGSVSIASAEQEWQEEGHEHASEFVRRRAIFAPIPQVKDIALINEPMLTGNAAVDALAPLGKGQNMLLIGQDGVGKTDLAIGAIATQIRAARARSVAGGNDETKSTVRCVYALTSPDESVRADTLRKLDEAGIRDDVVVISTRGSNGDKVVHGGGNESDGNDVDVLPSAEAVAVAAAACAVGEAFALADGCNSLVVVDDINRHKTLWDWTTRVLVDMYGVDAVVKDDREGGASSEMRGYYSALIQRAGKYNKRNGDGSVTLVLITSLPGPSSSSDGDDKDRALSPEDFNGASQKVKDRVDILVRRGVPLTPSNLRKIQILVPSASEYENARRLALQHADDLISMSDGQIWLDANLLGAGKRSPPFDPQRSITRVGIGADTESRADAPALRGLTGGLRFELAQAVDSIGGGGGGVGVGVGVGQAPTKADEKQLVRRDAWLLAMHQERGTVRALSENVVTLLAAKIGQLDDVVRAGGKEGTDEGSAAIRGMIDFVRTAASDIMDEVDGTEDLSDDARVVLEGAIKSYFESLA